MPKVYHPDFSYQRHKEELKILLKKFGIVPHQQLTTLCAYEQENKSSQTDGVKTTIGQVVVYIENHLSEELSLDKLAKKVQLSKYQLIRGFRKEKNTTPWQFLITKRIDKGKILLKEGRSPGQVAVETGFYDQAHFSKSFQKATGLTPKEYQEKYFRNRN